MQNKSIVSIQLLFLFNESLLPMNVAFMSFNTASVLIQQNQAQEVRLRTDSFNTASVLIQRNTQKLGGVKRKQFQYSFCSYST